MAIDVQEMNRGRTGDGTSRQVRYKVVGTEGDAELTDAQIQNAVADEADEDIDGLLFMQNVSIEDVYFMPDRTLAFATAVYSPPEEGTPIGGGDGAFESTYDFAYQAPSDHIYRSLLQTKYGTGPDLGRRIKVNPESGETEGMPLPSASTTNILRRTVPSGFITSAYEALVEGLVGGVNASPFKGRPAGSMRFVQIQSSTNSTGSSAVTWGFDYKANATDIEIPRIVGAPITVSSKGGHDLMWEWPQNVPDAATGKIVSQPSAIYVEQVCPLIDFNLLGA